MTTYDEAMTALRAADASGNTEDAKRLAVIADSLKNKPAEPRSFGAEIGRQVGLTARAAVEGMSALPNMIGDALGLKSTEAVSGLLTRIGIPVPENGTERVAQDAAKGMAGAVPFVAGGNLMAGAARPLTQAMGKVLGASPLAQVAGGGMGGGAAGAAREAGAGPGVQTAVGFAAGALPFMAPAGAAGAIRAGLRGPESNIAPAVERIERFRETGVEPTPSQAFQTHTGQATESYLSRSPGGHGQMRDNALKQAEDLGKRTDEVASILAGKTSPMIAGRAVEEGITGEGGFLDHFKDTSKALYDRLDQYLPAEKPVKVDNLTRTLDRLTTPTKGAEEVSKLLMNSKVVEVRQALKTDLGGVPGKTLSILGADGKPISTIQIGGKAPSDAIPFAAMKELRSRVGEMLGDPTLTSEIPRRQLKALYASLSADMKSAVEATGSKDAVSTFNRANQYTRAGHARIDNVLQPVLDKKAPENIFSAALSGSKDGDTTIHSIMNSLPDSSQKVLAATVLRKLGRATPSSQSAEGDAFSAATFLTNWNRISPEAKRSLFSRFGPKYVENVNKIAKTAEDIVGSGKVYANPSGTAPALTLQHTVGGAVLALLMGHPAIAAGLAGENAISLAVAKRMTDPKFVDWLAKGTDAPISSLALQLNLLSQKQEQE